MNPWNKPNPHCVPKLRKCSGHGPPRAEIVEPSKVFLENNASREPRAFEVIANGVERVDSERAASTHPCTLLLDDELFAMFFRRWPRLPRARIRWAFCRFIPWSPHAVSPEGKPTRVTLPLHLFDLDQLRWIQAFLEHQSLVREPHETSLERRLLKAAAVINEPANNAECCKTFLPDDSVFETRHAVISSHA